MIKLANAHYYCLSTLGSKTLAVSHLAVADSLGAIWTTVITQDITSPRTVLGDNVNVSEATNDTAGVSAEEPLAIGEKDGRAATAFCWVIESSAVGLIHSANKT